MPLEQFAFGIGSLFAVRTDIANPTPTRFGTVQDVTVDFAFTTKSLTGQYQAPVVAARAGLKITGKAKAAKISARTFNDVFFGQTLATGSQIQILDEGGTAGTAIPTTPFQITAANGSSMSTGSPGIDLGVYNVATGVQMTRVATTPTAGQYSFASATGIYTFAAADNVSGVKVAISYTYQQATTGGRITAYNQLMGAAPTFQLYLGESFQANKQQLTLYSVIATKLALNFKNEDFEVPEFDFEAYCDSQNRFFDFSNDLS